MIEFGTGIGFGFAVDEDFMLRIDFLRIGILPGSDKLVFLAFQASDSTGYGMMGISINTESKPRTFEKPD